MDGDACIFNFKFGMQAPRKSPDMTPENNFFEKGRG